MNPLKTDYKNDELKPSMNGKRHYAIKDSDGVTTLYNDVILEDVSEYDVHGDEFGKDDINAMNDMANKNYEDNKVILTKVINLDEQLENAEMYAEEARLAKNNAIMYSSYAEEAAEQARIAADKASEFTPEGYNEFVSSTESRLDGLRNFNAYADITFMDTVDENENHRTRLQIDRKSRQAYLFNHEEDSEYWQGEIISTYVDVPSGETDILQYVENTLICAEGSRKLVHGFNMINAPLNNNDNDFYYDVIKGSNEWFKVIAYDVRTTNIYINEKTNNVWRGWKIIRCDMITGTLSAGSTSITITDSRITTDSVFRFFTSKFGLSPTGATVNNGSIILTFEAQSEPITVGVKVE